MVCCPSRSARAQSPRQCHLTAASRRTVASVASRPWLRPLMRDVRLGAADMNALPPQWNGSRLAVTAKLVPRYLWQTASIDVFLDEQCILRTGGQFKFVGSHASEFVYRGTTH